MTVWEMAQRVGRCCRDTLGYLPEITRPVPEPHENSASLLYDITKLKRTQFFINGDMDTEIANTLKMCAAVQQGRRA